MVRTCERGAAGKARGESGGGPAAASEGAKKEKLGGARAQGETAPPPQAEAWPNMNGPTRTAQHERPTKKAQGEACPKENGLRRMALEGSKQEWPIKKAQGEACPNTNGPRRMAK